LSGCCGRVWSLPWLYRSIVLLHGLRNAPNHQLPLTSTCALNVFIEPCALLPRTQPPELATEWQVVTHSHDADARCHPLVRSVLGSDLLVLCDRSPFVDRAADVRRDIAPVPFDPRCNTPANWRDCRCHCERGIPVVVSRWRAAQCMGHTAVRTRWITRRCG